MNRIPENELQALTSGRYSSLKEIAAGGFKRVYKAVLADGSGKEALKVVEIPDGRASEAHEKYREECINRVKREVRVLEHCEGPYLVKVAGLGFLTPKVEGVSYVIYAEEFLEGKNLWDLLRDKSREKPSEDELKTLLVCLLEAIQELWDSKVIHRDIKPLNVMKLDDADRPFVLIDLGIAFSMQETALTFNALNREPMATYRYIAPERCDPRHRASLDFRCDLYSAALTIFEYAAGQHPIAHDSDDKMKTVTRAVMQAPKKLIEVRPDLDPQFCQMIDQMLKKNPALRPANLAGLIRKYSA